MRWSKRRGGLVLLVATILIGSALKLMVAPVPRVMPASAVELEELLKTQGYLDSDAIVSAHRLPWSSSSLHEIVVPLLSVSLSADPKRYLTRLLMSIDVHVGRIVVLIGNEDQSALDQMQAQVDQISSKFVKADNLQLIRINYNPGCAAGWNIGMRTMLDAPPDLVSWSVIVNNDISFHPGSLQKLAAAINSRVHENPNFGIGFLNLIKAARWSAFAPTRQLASRVGLFDENFYPVYFEDNDYAIRVQLSGLRASVIKEATVEHGEADGSIAYYSGTLKAMDSDSRVREHLRATLDRGIRHGQRYVESKWGSPLIPTAYNGPFDDTNVPLSAWVLLPDTRKWIQHYPGAREPVSLTAQHNDIRSTFSRTFDRAFDIALPRNQSSRVLALFPGSSIPRSRLLNFNTTDMGPTFCAFESHLCRCNGLVYYGVALSAASDDDLFPGVSSLEDMMQDGSTLKKQVNGEILCTNSHFGGDPMDGSVKYCRCISGGHSMVKLWLNSS